MNVILDGTQLLDVAECPRCGNAHAGVEVRAFRRASTTYGSDGKELALSRWLTCPETSEPVLVASGEPTAILCTRTSIGG